MNPALSPPSSPALLATFLHQLMLPGRSVIGEFLALAHLPWCYACPEALAVRSSLLAAFYRANVARNLMSVPARA